MMEEWLLMQHSNVYVLFLPAQYFVRIFAKYSRGSAEIGCRVSSASPHGLQKMK
jgi:hypothetical protein